MNMKSKTALGYLFWIFLLAAGTYAIGYNGLHQYSRWMEPWARTTVALLFQVLPVLCAIAALVVYITIAAHKPKPTLDNTQPSTNPQQPVS